MNIEEKNDIIHRIDMAITKARFEPNDFMRDRHTALCLHNKFKPGSRKAITFFEGKPFAYKVDDVVYHGFIQTGVIKEIAQFKCFTLYKVSSKGGLLYCLRRSTGKNIEYRAWTSHCFDRMELRLKLKGRDKVLKKFIIDRMLNPLSFLHSDTDYLQDVPRLVQLPTTDGVMLGVELNELVLYKTFVSDELLKGEQIDGARLFFEANEELKKLGVKHLDKKTFAQVVSEIVKKA